MLKKSQYPSVLRANYPPAAMEVLCSKAKPMIKGLSMEKEETAAYGDIKVNRRETSSKFS